MKSITAIIVVKNNPQHLFETLASIKNIASEIIIGDLNIGNDYRKKLLLNKKVKLIKLPKDVPFADLVKEDLKIKAGGEFILYLDPDEIFPKIPNEEISQILSDYDFVHFPRKNIIFGKWIEHSRWWPDYQLRLFKKDYVEWPKVLHPVPLGKGRGLKIAAEEEKSILHYNYDNMDQFIEKATRYAKFEAGYLIDKKEDYTLNRTLRRSLSEFIGRFFSSDGYRDGMHGFVLSLLQMFYYFLVYFYYWEAKKYGDIEKNPARDFENFARELNFETNFWLLEKKLISDKERIKYKIRNKITKIFK